jgi:translation initiation factor IF-1
MIDGIILVGGIIAFVIMLVSIKTWFALSRITKHFSRKVFPVVKNAIASDSVDEINQNIVYDRYTIRSKDNSLQNTTRFDGTPLFVLTANYMDVSRKMIEQLLKNKHADINTHGVQAHYIFEAPTGECLLSVSASCFAACIYSDLSQACARVLIKSFLMRDDLIVDETCYEALIIYLVKNGLDNDISPLLNDSRFDINKVTGTGESWLYYSLNKIKYRLDYWYPFGGGPKVDDLMIFFIQKKKKHVLSFLLSSSAFLNHYNETQFDTYIELAIKVRDEELVDLLRQKKEVLVSGEFENNTENTSTQPTPPSIELRGRVSKKLPRNMFEVMLEQNKHKIFCHASGKLRSSESDIKIGQFVLVEMSPYDLSKGRIVGVLRKK